jgi:hypothetical protein
MEGSDRSLGNGALNADPTRGSRVYNNDGTGVSKSVPQHHICLPLRGIYKILARIAARVNFYVFFAGFFQAIFPCKKYLNVDTNSLLTGCL